MTYRPTWSSPQDARLFDVQWSGAVTLQISIMAWRVTAGAVMWSIDSAAASDRQFCDDQYFSADQLTRRCDHQRLSMALQCVIDEWDVIPHHSLDDDVQMRCILHTTSSVLILLSLSWLNFYLPLSLLHLSSVLLSAIFNTFICIISLRVWSVRPTVVVRAKHSDIWSYICIHLW